MEEIDYVAALYRHSVKYELSPPIYHTVGPRWHCHYMGNTTISADQGSQADVARIMLVFATVNRPLHPVSGITCYSVS